MFSIYRLFSRLFPKNIKANINKLLEYSNIDIDVHRFLGFQLLFSVLLSLSVAIYSTWLLKYNFALIFASFFVITQVFIYMWLLLSADKKGRFTESILPDVLQIMASNLKAGITIDKALFMAARPEFGPFKKELDRVGKEVAVGKDITKALKDLTLRIKSAKLEKTVYLIINGVKSGGNLAPLLERTAEDLRDQEIMERKIRASIGMYKIFITVAIAFAAPLLFALSSVVVDILTKTFSNIDMPKSSSMPINISSVSMPIDFVITSAMIFIVSNCVLGSIVLGHLSKGTAKDGVKYMIPLAAVSLLIFILIRKFLTSALGSLFGM